MGAAETVAAGPIILTMRRALAILFLLTLIAVPASALTDEPDSVIDVVEVSGPIDQFSASYIIDAINDAASDGSQMVILKIDSPGSVTDEIGAVLDVVENPPLPIVAWIGDAPAQALGGSWALADAAQVTIAAPGAEVGYGTGLVMGSDDALTGGWFGYEPGSAPPDVAVVSVGEYGIDDLQPALGALIISLDGRQVDLGDRQVTLSTAREVTDDDGNSRLEVSSPVRFSEPGLWARTMRLGITPEAAFFFLTVGLAFAAFEFYAIGPGLAAATAVVPVLLAGYGLSAMPFSWGLIVVLFAMWLYAADFQRGGFGVISYIATAVLFIGGLFITDTRPEMPPSVGAALATTVFVALFFMFAMPTVARSRFTTQTMGREHLIGAVGVAVTEIKGGGTVEVNGAKWQATSHREAGIQPGDAVVVDAVQGLFLEVDLAEREKDA